ncbi:MULTISPECIES: hypothetical protein [Methylobacterium]|jgi:hypothetical protein|uniref:Uncharacterized protein n=2 Tax=Methylobacterium TaxID=407 RepID=A0A0C6FFB7_9HYPH|nr:MULTISPECIES: hypothetical protein [Methylobacterium]MBK3400354.1 hypothetical protein [Methylobacterium ajmalii]MBK3411914.1 hypothetical protein [Methylobacterium ajmalii]MBZ6417041.1 hypothetical protein [Methylobacterium sp.]SEP40127.1 hypothetical protein SAMN04487843_115120 [Methylobacterium sp. ap11]SFF47004.1 hypothetical protein SAMN04487844_12122 [Methylobacterium sp. yr596]
MIGHQRRPSADIIPFRAGGPRRAGGTTRAGGAGEAASGPVDHPAADPVRGTILLFTGVRYERLPDPAETDLPAPERRCTR